MNGQKSYFFSIKNFLTGLLILKICFAISLFTQNYWLSFITSAIWFALVLFLKDSSAFYLLLIFIPLSVHWQVTSSLSTDTPDEIMMVVLTLFTGFYLVFKTTYFPKRIFYNTLFILLGLHIIWILINIIFSHNHLLSLKYFIAKTWYLISFSIAPIIFLKTKQSFSRLAKCMIIIATAFVVYGLIEHAFQKFSPESINNLMQPYFKNHVIYGAYIACTIPVIATSFIISNNKLLKIVLLILFILFLAALFFSYSRGAWIGLVLSVFSVWLIKRKIFLQAAVLFLVFIIATIIYLSVHHNYENYLPKSNQIENISKPNERIKNFYNLKDLSSAERTYRWIAGIRMSTEHPVTGFGTNTFVDYYKSFTDENYRTSISDNLDRSTVHNYFLLILIEQGYIGLFIFLLIIFYFFYKCQKLFHTLKDVFFKHIVLIVSSVFSILLTINFFSDLIECDKTGTYFFLCIGIIIWIDLKKTELEL